MHGVLSFSTSAVPRPSHRVGGSLEAISQYRLCGQRREPYLIFEGKDLVLAAWIAHVEDNLSLTTAYHTIEKSRPSAHVDNGLTGAGGI